jgi:quinol monooxygenase YgiN
MLHFHAVLPIDPAQRDLALESLADLVEHSRTEDGVVEYHATVDVKNTNLVHLIEEFEDEAAFETHQATAHVEEFEAVLPDLLAGEPEVVRLAVDEKHSIEI